MAAAGTIDRTTGSNADGVGGVRARAEFLGLRRILPGGRLLRKLASPRDADPPKSVKSPLFL